VRLLDQFMSEKFQAVLNGEQAQVELDPSDEDLLVDLEVLGLLVGYLTHQQSCLQLQEINGRVVIYMTPASTREPVHL